MDKKSGQLVGRIAGLWRYPVKSMGAEPLANVEVSWFGLTGDRRWAFVRNDAVQSGFPWLTIRERNDMHHYLPSFTNPDQPDNSPTTVRSPTGEIYDVMDTRLGDELYPPGSRVIKQNRGIFDTFPLSLISMQSIANLSRHVGYHLDVQRFRPNLLVDLIDETPFVEDHWLECVLRIGNFRMRVDKRDGRCAIITVAPETATRDPAILRHLITERQGCLGVYGSTVEPGSIAIGDEVVIESTP